MLTDETADGNGKDLVYDGLWFRRLGLRESTEPNETTRRQSRQCMLEAKHWLGTLLNIKDPDASHAPFRPVRLRVSTIRRSSEY